MDAILDLTSRAVSLISLIQDSIIRLKTNCVEPADQVADTNLFYEFIIEQHSITKLDYFIENGVKISWISVEKPLDVPLTTQHCFDRCISLINWINTPENMAVFKNRFGLCQHFPSPEQWREALREVLYMHKGERVKLATSLQYLPVQIVLTVKNAMAFSAKEQRLLQVWNVSSDSELTKFLSLTDIKKYKRLQETFKIIESTADYYLSDEKMLVDKLVEERVPLSFLQTFNCELIEVCNSRVSRKDEIISSDHLFNLRENTAQVSAIDDSNRNDRADSFEKIFSNLLTKPSHSNRVSTHTDHNGKTNRPASSKITYVPEVGIKHDYGLDVLQSAKNMKMWALALSGGGIRSATFNLGVLQGLAKNGLLSKFDYLSTVSGGGYVGSWLVSWIARKQSVLTVGNRLNPTKAWDPLADEVRPIRWLRMYSNYLSPNSSAMSTDSWTTAMTLVRNMLISQLVILVLFLTLISLGRTVFVIWLQLSTTYNYAHDIKPATFVFNGLVGVFLFLAAVFAGLGMYSYHEESFPKINISSRVKRNVTHFLVATGCLAAFMLSIWMYRHATIPPLEASPLLSDFSDTFEFFYWTMGLGSIALIFVAVLGRYDRCIKKKGNWLITEISIGILLSVCAAIVGGIFITLIAQLADRMAGLPIYAYCIDHFGAKIFFVFLPPLVIEALSTTVVLRMAFLGINFPDDRREWWGRIGGVVHRICLIWILLFGITMLGKGLVELLILKWSPIKEFFAVGWGATLLLGIRYAYTGTTSGKEKPTSSTSGFKEKLALAAPYLFLFGLMIYVPQLLDDIQPSLLSLLPNNMPAYITMLLLTLVLGLITMVLSRQIGVNQFSMHLFYRNRLVRAFLGATRIRLERQRSASPFTGFDMKDDLLIAELLESKNYFGPYPIINATMSASSDIALDRQDRKAESFIFSPLFCGFDFSRTRESADAVNKSYDYAYRPTGEYGYENGPHIGTAMAISGAAANPNMGYHTSAATAFLLSIFNIRLGWWMGNPRTSKWNKSDPDFGLPYLIYELTGNTNTKRDFVCLSDGGHFDNMGLYELIRRKCMYIVLSDAEQDESLNCEGLANAVRKCRIDFGVEISFEHIEGITALNSKHFSEQNYAVGKIIYPENGNEEGVIIYIKASMTANESVDIQEYAKKNKTFPHQSTVDQFFNEEQFESYRKLGMNTVDKLLK
jgi:hypothetical protein